MSVPSALAMAITAIMGTCSTGKSNPKPDVEEGLPIVSIVFPFWGYPIGAYIIRLVKQTQTCPSWKKASKRSLLGDGEFRFRAEVSGKGWDKRGFLEVE